MDNFLSGGILELEQAKAAINNANKLSRELEDAERLLRTNEKDLEAQKKFMNDKINASIKNRHNELAKSHDEQIQEAKRDLKSIQKGKKIAKTQAVNKRITGETGMLIQENKQLISQIERKFKDAKIPKFFNNSFFFALFNAKTAKDFIIFAITVLIAIAAIPNVVCALIQTSTFVKVLVYALIVIFFIGTYFLAFIALRGDVKRAAISESRKIREKIEENNRQIKILSNDIRNDNDESSYNLEEFDAQLQHYDNVINDREAAKASALENFDTNTAATIRAEIEKENLPIIEQLEIEGTALRSEIAKKKSIAQAAKAAVTNEYATYLGNKNTTPEKIDALISVIKEGKAQTIMQAIDILNGEVK